MSRSRTRSSKKKTVTIAVLVACLLLAAIGGTIAWMTVKDSLTNQFTVGNFNDPEKKPDGTEDLDPDGDDKDKLDGHLYEPRWDADNNKITPGGTLPKDPYVGIGADSEDAYVYVYVRNSAADPNDIYFALNEGWEVVDESLVTGATTLDNRYDPKPTDADLSTKYYVSGLFKYSTELTAKTDEDSWTTTPVFDEVFVRHSADNTTLSPVSGSNITALKVTALLHQVTSGNNTTNLETVADIWAKEEAATLATEALDVTTE